MIKTLSHVSILVLNQESAYDFYVNKLGFKVHTDMTMEGGFRWLTVTAPGQPDLEIILMPIENLAKDEEDQKVIRRLVTAGTFGAGVFGTEDCRATYAELLDKGVKFKGEPKDEFYGVEAVMQDDSGNWFSISQPKPH